ncbi:ATP-binding protein [Gordonia sp. CPCC 205515]|uniref:sensor histidine kinase n=1 Tax=Gordonia sp. CPCC 205515 TaxID=3140791 RepID=UPI003AF3AA67
MAADTAALPPLTVDDDERDQLAGRRILRLMSVFVSVGYLAYAAMTASMVVDSLPIMDTWWTVSALILTFGTGIALGPLSWRGDIRRMRIAAATASAGYLLTLALWWFGWNGTVMDTVSGIWFSQFSGLPAIASALAFRAVIPFVYLAVVSVSTVVISHASRLPELGGPIVADVAWAFSFSLIFVAASVMAIRTAGILDATRARAYQVTADVAAARARSAERSRFDALTHDNVMSTLLLAARRGASPELAQDAHAALHAVDQAGQGQEPLSVTAFEATSAVRAAVALVDPALRVAVDGAELDEAYPGAAVSAMASATAEAVRNSRRHAGAAATVEVTVVAEPDRLRAEVVDDGVGFDPDVVAASRLGIAVSIRGRMSKVNGGAAHIDSRPGHGTRVLLEWVR